MLSHTSKLQHCCDFLLLHQHVSYSILWFFLNPIHDLISQTKFMLVYNTLQWLGILRSTARTTSCTTDVHRFLANHFRYLFNSLFKVLFTFPSQYLFAIGQPPIFSVRWSLPPNLSCNPKQLDSLKAHQMAQLVELKYGIFTLSDSTFQWNYAQVVRDYTSIDYNSAQKRRLSSCTLPASVALTEGILVSFFSSG